MNDTELAIVAVVAALAVFGVVAITLVTIPLQQAEAAKDGLGGCPVTIGEHGEIVGSIPFNASKGRCFGH